MSNAVFPDLNVPRVVGNMARKMLGLPIESLLPSRLERLIARTSSACQTVNGELFSRQAIAVLVAQFVETITRSEENYISETTALEKFPIPQGDEIVQPETNND